MTLSHSPNIVRDGLVFSFDPANKKSYSPNLVTFPIYTASNWSNIFASAATVTSGVSAPDGSNTAVRFACNTSGQSLFRITFPDLAPNGTDTYTCSFYAKLISGTTGGLSAGLADTNPTISNYVSQLIQGEWVRVSISGVPASGSRTWFDIIDNGTRDYVVDLWGVQVEKSSSATPFNPNYYNQSKTIYNLVNNSQTGTLATIQSNSSDNIRSLIFNGTSDYITLDGSSFDFSTGQTIFMILKRGTGASSLRRNPYNQAYGGYGTITHETNNGFNYYHGTNGSNGNPYQGSGSSFTVVEGEMAAVTLVRDSNNISWYKNGEFSNSHVNNYPVASSSVNTILIGNGYTNDYLGEINYIALYDRGLSSDEVKQNFNALRGRYGL